MLLGQVEAPVAKISAQLDLGKWKKNITLVAKI